MKNAGSSSLSQQRFYRGRKGRFPKTFRGETWETFFRFFFIIHNIQIITEAKKAAKKIHEIRVAHKDDLSAAKAAVSLFILI